ncbi:MAG: hypothetical protein JRG67_08190 [Deltaproteobacteria bacterium]|jgi:hypothetical protein|nr:hypothetical protein [Deltaproteobacteria bacterium]MBW2211014.1 hypothetical protein [Deltaproteobacteria bacterium]MBW2551205.1 hypothetical protein [Deltaproteobacteria bacterium]MBW2628623.1 hypothetical protein [Deltaproteobacteria bacterium]MBW2686241.1 hypothetical protein [Deltaproteobacteria bacterium]
MTKTVVCLVSVTFAFLLLGACGGSDSDPGLVDPTNPNALSQVLVIPGAQRVDGQPPQSSGDPDAPVITGGADLETISGEQTVIEVGYDSPTGYVDCYVQVIGADDYFLVSVPSSATTGTIRIPVEIPSNVASGAFDFYTCIAGENGAVSNPIRTGVDVTFPGVPGGGGDVICASSDSSVGSAFDCPNGSTLDFCIDVNSGSCYYTVGGRQVDCGNCQTNPDAISGCVQRAVELCI